MNMYVSVRNRYTSVEWFCAAPSYQVDEGREDDEDIFTLVEVTEEVVGWVVLRENYKNEGIRRKIEKIEKKHENTIKERAKENIDKKRRYRIRQDNNTTNFKKKT
ncbi:hypothetical protein POVCU2_0005740 [Plasmodium ovale curtisi]|uniref:Uncharacterized protein n=1 Tax=Plasmodium ovale curtisi TaxID=864141 RepID=A0A1A8VPK7_PLAOA|nr:hypothetical protein POVCU2_0005740 [Plasmodium ovale curtisi]SBS81258.1 hypothetical protein POVCU1_005140 [Plasmodium ovale curtisi]